MSSQPSWRVLLGILGGGVSPVLYILVLFQTKKCHFSHPLNSDLATKKFMSLFILRLEQQQQQQQKNKQTKNKKNKNKNKIYIKSLSFFLTHLELKQTMHSYPPIVPLKIIAYSRPKWAKSIPVFRPEQHRNLPLWGDTYL